MVEGARLESVCRGNSTVGSNPTLSANFSPAKTRLFSTSQQENQSLNQRARMRRAPFRALAVIGIFGIMLAGFWMSFRIWNQTPLDGRARG